MQIVKSLPVSLALHSLQRNRVRELHLLVCLKNHCAGHFEDSYLDSMFKFSGIKTRSTFNRQIKTLLKDRWIFKAKGSSFYNIRSFRSICLMNHIAPRFLMKYICDLPLVKMRAYLYAGVVGYDLKKLRYFLLETGEGKMVAFHRGKAFQTINRFGFIRQRIGVSMNRVKKIIGLSRQYMNKMKIEATKYGFLVCKAILVDLPDGLKRRLNDEIICKIGFSRRSKKCCISKGVFLGGYPVPLLPVTVNCNWYAFTKGRISKKPEGKRPNKYA